MENQSLLLGLTGDMPLFRIIDFLVENKGLDFSKKDIAQGAGLSRASLFNHWPRIERFGLVKITRSFGKTRLYSLNTDNPLTKKILELEATLIRQAMVVAAEQKKEAAVARAGYDSSIEFGHN